MFPVSEGMGALSAISRCPVGLQIVASSVTRRRTSRKLGWRGACALRTSREKFAVTLYWFQDYRGSPAVAHDFVDGRTMRRRTRTTRKGARGSRFGWKRVEDDVGGDGEWGILYPRIRNCDALLRAISTGISIRVRNVNTANREMYYYLSRKFIDSANCLADCLFFAMSIAQCQFRWCICVFDMEELIKNKSR